MIVYAYIDGYFYEAHINLANQTLDFVLRWRDGQEQRPTRCSWDDLTPHEQDQLLPKIRKAIRSYDKDNS